MKKTKKIAYLLLVFYSLWGFFIYKTTFSTPIMAYIFASILLLSFLFVFLNSQSGRISMVSAIWIPYISITAISLLLNGNMEMLFYWLVVLFILLSSRSRSISNEFPFNLIVISAFVSLAGIVIQMLFPGFHASHIKVLFQNENTLNSWEDSNYGYSGFTYQLAAAALPMLYAIPIILYFDSYSVVKKKVWNNKVLLFIVFTIGVFLTGKRAMSAMAIIIPIFIYFVSQKLTLKKVFRLFVIIIISFIGIYYFVQHSSSFVDSAILGRFAETAVESQYGEDITSGRSYLYALAFKTFEDNPLTGIGVGNFIDYTGAYTSPHNTYLEVLCEQGIIGFFLYIIPLLYCLILSIIKIDVATQMGLGSAVRFSIFMQLVYILYAFTGNVNSELGTFGMYFCSLALIQFVLDKKIKKA